MTAELDLLRQGGFDIAARNHAVAILGSDFPQALKDLCTTLLAVRLRDDEIVRSGGGEARSTQRLRRALAGAGWPKHRFVIRKSVDGVEREATSHEIDHVLRAPAGTLALEIEWNNKDPFFDRDLENFQRLHADSAISVGVIITRGSSLQQALPAIVRRCAEAAGIEGPEDLHRFDLSPTRRQAHEVARRMAIGGRGFLDAWVEHFVADKFGAATTHWQKLEDRISRGVGNPCPLLLIGLPAAIVGP